MTDKLMQFLKHELTLLSELNDLAEKQKSALVQFRLNELDNISSHQEKIADKLHTAEKQRHGLISAWLKISEADSAKLNITHFKEYFDSKDLHDLQELQNSMRSMMLRLHSLNTTNRVLTKRAQRSVGNIISVFTNGKNYMCNVKV